MAPQSGVDHRQDRSADLDFESETAEARTVENTRAANEAQVAHAMNWKILPEGALARVRWNPKSKDVEAVTRDNLNPEQYKALQLLIDGVKKRALSSTTQADKVDTVNDVITIW